MIACKQRSAAHMLCLPHVQALEHEKRLIKGLLLEQLDELEVKRHAAAATIQAYWRGAQQRQQLRQDFPALVSRSAAAGWIQWSCLAWQHTQRKHLHRSQPGMLQVLHLSGHFS